jgi:hypothetical protein
VKPTDGQSCFPTSPQRQRARDGHDFYGPWSPHQIQHQDEKDTTERRTGQIDRIEPARLGRKLRECNRDGNPAEDERDGNEAVCDRKLRQR